MIKLDMTHSRKSCEEWSLLVCGTTIVYTGFPDETPCRHSTQREGEHMRVCACVCACPCVRTSVRACVPVCVRVYVCTRVCLNICVRKCRAWTRVFSLIIPHPSLPFDSLSTTDHPP